MPRILARSIVAVMASSTARSPSFVGAAQADGTSFFDAFLAFNESRWTETEHDLGCSHLDPANVEVVDGNARFKIPGRTLQGAEIRSDELYRHGTYSTSMKPPHVPSSITGFFLYRPPDHERKIDVEVFNDCSRRVMFTTYSNGRQTHTVTRQLPFDPTAGYHTYAFRYDAGLARFMVDGKVMQTWKTGVSRGPMHPYTNLRFPTWLDGKRPLVDSYLYVDWIRYSG